MRTTPPTAICCSTTRSRERIRCVQCHMGSPTQDFVLGFIPLQVARRATGTGGTYEPTGADELTQLQRLIDYGVITGHDLARRRAAAGGVAGAQAAEDARRGDD